jgi:hypothetical protein
MLTEVGATIPGRASSVKSKTNNGGGEIRLGKLCSRPHLADIDIYLPSYVGNGASNESRCSAPLVRIRRKHGATAAEIRARSSAEVQGRW